MFAREAVEVRMGDTSISATVSGGAAGVVGAQVVRIENLYVGAPAPPRPLVGPIPPCPYPGLAYFGPQDAARFFGREQAIQALVAAVTKGVLPRLLARRQRQVFCSARRARAEA